MDSGTIAVTGITLLLFVAALFFKGITHDLFLEAGVFLISVKIVLMTYKNTVSAKAIQDKLDTILATLEKNNASDAN